MIRKQRMWGKFLCIPLLFLVFCLNVAAEPVSDDQRNAYDEFLNLLKNHLEFTTKDLNKMKAGDVITKRLKTNVKQEIAFISVAKIMLPKELIIRNYSKQGMNIETITSDQWGIFSQPPVMDDVENFTFPNDDLEKILKCKPGKCKIKLPTSAIQRIRKLDTSTPGVKARINTMFQEGIISYVKRYLKSGDKALVEYNDKKSPVWMAQEFRGLLQESPYLYEDLPFFLEYLQNFPNAELPNSKTFLYWMKESFGGKLDHPVLTVNHMIVHQPQTPKGGIIGASKQLYASHYFESALTLTGVVADFEESEPASYLLHIHRSRIDVLRKIPRFLARVLRKRGRALIHHKMETVKKNLEDAYQAN